MMQFDAFNIGTIPKIGPTGAFRWSGTDSEENYRLRGNTEYSEESITYARNEYGYRCPSFQHVKRNQPLFIGCSITFGTGLPMEETWAHKVFLGWQNEITTLPST